MKRLIPDFGTDKDQLFDWLKENKNLVIRQKKLATKESDGIYIDIPKDEYVKPDSNKEIGVVAVMPSSIELKTVINSTNLIDGHLDLHLPKGWNRTVKHQSKNGLHLKEHKMTFENTLADGANEVKVYVTNMSWKDLGYDFEGNTDLLMHKLILKHYEEPKPHQITKSEMYYRYMEGEVKNHSVGMGYGEVLFCVNSEDRYWREEKANFDEFITFAVNPDAAIEEGYFWAVKEMKYFEGSAVPRGSNWLTPTLSIREIKSPTEDGTEFKIDPPLGTQTKTEQTEQSEQQANAPDYSEIAKALLKNLNN